MLLYVLFSISCIISLVLLVCLALIKRLICPNEPSTTFFVCYATMNKSFMFFCSCTGTNQQRSISTNRFLSCPAQFFACKHIKETGWDRGLEPASGDKVQRRDNKGGCFLVEPVPLRESIDHFLFLLAVLNPKDIEFKAIDEFNLTKLVKKTCKEHFLLEIEDQMLISPIAKICHCVQTCLIKLVLLLSNFKIS